MSNDMTARVEMTPDGPVLHDPAALAMIAAVGKHNCANTLAANMERVYHFKKRMAEVGKSPEECVIVLLNVDDANGRVIADIMMPGYDWKPIRDRGEVPFARGFGNREFVQAFLDEIDVAAATRLRESNKVSVVVVDHGVAEIFHV